LLGHLVVTGFPPVCQARPGASAMPIQTPSEAEHAVDDDSVTPVRRLAIALIAEATQVEQPRPVLVHVHPPVQSTSVYAGPNLPVNRTEHAVWSLRSVRTEALWAYPTRPGSRRQSSPIRARHRLAATRRHRRERARSTRA
jgi:hypothetical protein